MIAVVRAWFNRYFSDEQAVVLAAILVAGFSVILMLGDILAPVLASLVVAFLLQGLVARLEKYRVPHVLAVGLVFMLFLALLIAFLFGLIPLVWRQSLNLFNELPGMLSDWQEMLLLLPKQYPEFITEAQIVSALESTRGELGKIGQWLLSYSLASLSLLVSMMIYLVLVPILVFFFLKDKQEIRNWFSGYLPTERSLIRRVWVEMNEQMANYIRGKVFEIVITGVITYIGFAVFDLNYAALLALLVGLSVVIPYVGAVVVTVPVALIALFQWGWGDQFIYLMLVYGIIQGLDGNVLVPLLFSEAVNLHPVAIICAVLLFGGLLGFWGVFFAIPLATLFKAVLNAWPRRPRET